MPKKPSDNPEIEIVSEEDKEEPPPRARGECVRTPYTKDEFRDALKLVLKCQPENPSGKKFVKTLQENFQHRKSMGLQSMISTKLRRELKSGSLDNQLKDLTPGERAYIRDYMKGADGFCLPPTVASEDLSLPPSDAMDVPANLSAVAKGEHDEKGASAEGFLIGNKFSHKRRRRQNAFYKRLKVFTAKQSGLSTTLSSNENKEDTVTCPEKKSSTPSASNTLTDVVFNPHATSTPKIELPGLAMQLVTVDQVEAIVRNTLEKQNKKANTSEQETQHSTTSVEAMDSRNDDELNEANRGTTDAQHTGESSGINDNSLSDSTLYRVGMEAESKEILSINLEADHSIFVKSTDNNEEDDEEERYEARLTTVTICEVFTKSKGKRGASFWAVPSKQGYTLTAKAAGNWSTVANPAEKPSELTAKEAFDQSVAKKDVLTLSEKSGANVDSVKIKSGKSPIKVTYRLYNMEVAPGVEGKALVLVRDD